MNSRETEYCQWWRYGDRGTRQGDDHDPDNRWKERQQHDSDVSRDSYHGYGGEAHASMKRTRGNLEYNDLPESRYSKEPLNREWRSPTRRSSHPRITPDKDIDLEREYAELRNEDQELLRKKKQLQLIEDQITHKKAALAIKQFSTKSETSPKLSVSKKKRRRFTEGDEEDFKFRQSPEEFTHRQPPNDFYRQQPEDFTYRQSPDDLYRQQPQDFKYRQPPKKFQQRQPPEEDFKYRQPPMDFKHRQPPEEDFKYRKTPRNLKRRQQPEDFTYRQPLEYHKDEPFKSMNNDDLWDGTQCEEFPSRVHTKPRERDDYHYPDYDYEDHRQNRMKGPMSVATKQSSGQVFEAEQDVANQGAELSWGADEQNTAEKGFQRFLSVLNKGVDISKLANIVCQAPGEDCVPPHSQTSMQNTVDPPWPHSGARQRESQTNTSYRGESQRSGGEDPGQDHIDFTSEERMTELPLQKGSHVGFQGHTLSNENSLPRNDAGGSHLSSSSKRGSPLEVEKSKEKPEDEQKCRQMQNVLQAIGMDLGLEELGLMSNRIQERLYGRRDSEKRESDREKETRQVFSPRRHSRSSSSGNSGFVHLTQQFSLKRDLREAPRDITNVNRTFEQSYTGDESSSISVKGTEGNKSQQSTVAPHSLFTHIPTYPPYPMPQTQAAPIMPPTYPPYSMPQTQAAPIMPPTYPSYPMPQTQAAPIMPPTYPSYPMPQTQAAPIMPTYPAGQYSPYTCSTVNTAVPPPWGINFGAMPWPPCPPVYPPHPSVPTFNTHLSASSQNNAYLQPCSNRQLTYVNLQHQNPVQPVNTTQRSTLSRSRCLQRIDMDRPQQTKTTTEEIENKSVKNTVELKKTLSQGVGFKKMPKLKQKKFRRCLYYSGKLKLIKQRKMTQAQLNATTEKSIADLIQLARLKAAHKSAAKSQGKVSGDGKKKTIKLRLLVNEAVVKLPGGTECSGMHCEPDERTEACNVGVEQSTPVE